MTVELPDALVRAAKVRAAREGRLLKDVLAEVMRRGLDTNSVAAPTAPGGALGYRDGSEAMTLEDAGDPGAITIRLPAALAAETREESGASGETAEEFVVSAVSKAVEIRRVDRVLARIEARGAAMRAAGRVNPDSTQLIRDLREGRGRRD